MPLNVTKGLTGATVGVVNNDGNLVITLWNDTSTDGLKVFYGDKTLDYSLDSNVITISNAELKSIMGSDYSIGLHQITIDNKYHLNLIKNLIITNGLNAPIIDDVLTPVIWKNSGSSAVLHLATHGEDIVSVTIGKAEFAYGFDGVLYNDASGYLTVPAALISGIATGYYNASVTTVMGKSADVSIQICDASVPNAVAFAQPTLTVSLSKLPSMQDKINLDFVTCIQCGTLSIADSSNFMVGKVAVVIYDANGQILDAYTRNNNCDAALRSVNDSVYTLSWMTVTGGILALQNYYNGLEISGATLRALGVGTYTIEIHNNHSIDRMTLVITA